MMAWLSAVGSTGGGPSGLLPDLFRLFVPFFNEIVSKTRQAGPRGPFAALAAGRQTPVGEDGLEAVSVTRPPSLF
jgi:hypothetical protein